ncbi:MAG: response regulator, partial [Ghiorsea sp.]
PAKVKKLDGTIVDVIVSVKVMPGHEKNMDRLLVALVDVSDISEAERHLKTSEARFRAMIEQSPLSMIIYTPAGVPVQVNQAFTNLWGVKLKDLEGYNILEDEQLVEKGLAPLIKRAFAGETVNLPAINYNPEEGLVVVGPKNDKWVRSFMYPVFNENGGILEVVLSHEDVTQKLQQEEQLTDSKASLEEAQKLAKVGNWDLNLQNNHLVWSDEIFRIFVVNKEKFGATYEAFLDAIHPDDRERVNTAYTQSLINKKPYEIEHRLLFANEQIKYVHERCETFFDDAGTAIRSVGTVQDVTELTVARQKETIQIKKIEHVQRLESLGVLAGGIAHDFNNLLTVIMGNAALASKHINESHDAKRFVTNIESTSERAAGLCNQMLAYSGKGKFIVKPLQLGELVEEMSQLLMVSIAKNIVLRLELGNQIPAVDADATQMQQIIMNLVINASEAIGTRSGSISIATGVVRADAAYLKSTFVDEGLAEGLYVYLEISDTGTGMDEETKKKLFDPFYTTKFTGRGLGMAAVLGIVRGHHGAIKVYSELGKGSTFKVLLPSSEETSATTANQQNETGDWLGEGTVLIVDDEETIREVASSMLKEIGFDTLTACDGIEGVEMYRTHQQSIKAVLLDMTMPRMGGEDAFSEMCRINPDVKVILSSGYNQQDATNRFAGKGLAGFLQKPYMATALALAMKEILQDQA